MPKPVTSARKRRGTPTAGTPARAVGKRRLEKLSPAAVEGLMMEDEEKPRQCRASVLWWMQHVRAIKNAPQGLNRTTKQLLGGSKGNERMRAFVHACLQCGADWVFADPMKLNHFQREDLIANVCELANATSAEWKAAQDRSMSSPTALYHTLIRVITRNDKAGEECDDNGVPLSRFKFPVPASFDQMLRMPAALEPAMHHLIADSNGPVLINRVRLEGHRQPMAERQEHLRKLYEDHTHEYLNSDVSNMNKTEADAFFRDDTADNETGCLGEISRLTLCMAIIDQALADVAKLPLITLQESETELASEGDWFLNGGNAARRLGIFVSDALCSAVTCNKYMKSAVYAIRAAAHAGSMLVPKEAAAR